MSISLIFSNDELNSEARAASDWAQITAVAPNHGLILIEEDVVDSIARVLEGVTLLNGEEVSSYPRDEDNEYSQGSYIPAFGPALLPTIVQDQIRDRLARGENGAQAARLFDLVIRLGLQVLLSGTDECPAHIKGVNWRGDDVTINRCGSAMFEMLRELGISCDPKSPTGEVEIATLAEAVKENGWRTDCAGRLDAFIAAAQRNNATTAYWA
jgi:hypothetical protein